MGRETVDDPQEEGPRSFTRFLECLAEGEANADLSEALFEIGAQSRKEALGRGGQIKAELTLTLKFVTDQAGQTVVTYAVKAKEPVPSRPATMFWLTPAGNFSPENPRQTRLPLHEVIDRDGVVHEVGERRTSRDV